LTSRNAAVLSKIVTVGRASSAASTNSCSKPAGEMISSRRAGSSVAFQNVCADRITGVSRSRWRKVTVVHSYARMRSPAARDDQQPVGTHLEGAAVWISVTLDGGEPAAVSRSPMWRTAPASVVTNARVPGGSR
jgi:hypothetical protein